LVKKKLRSQNYFAKNYKLPQTLSFKNSFRRAFKAFVTKLFCPKINNSKLKEEKRCPKHFCTKKQQVQCCSNCHQVAEAMRIVRQISNAEMVYALTVTHAG